MRGLNIFLILYGLILTVLVRLVPTGQLFLMTSIFFLCGITIGFKGYIDTLGDLNKNINSRLAKSKEIKKSLTEKSAESGDHISELRNKEAMIVSLYDMTKKMSQNLTFNEIFDVLSNFLKENFTFRKSELLILKEEDGNTKIDKAYQLYKEEDYKEKTDKFDHAELLKLFSKDKKEIYISKEDGTSYAAIPLLSENKFVGILGIEGLPAIDFDRFVIVATQFALEIKKVLLYETVEAIAIRDSLTGLYTRRYLFERLTEELNRSKRYNLKFAFLMIDIDDFKKCNDTHGHLVGDVILKEVARIIKESIREIDLAARFGGEEFSLVLPETDKKGALMVGERIRKRINENIFKAYDEKLKITVSAGISIYPDNSQKAEDIVDKSDQALYKAKTLGKNIVCEYND